MLEARTCTSRAQSWSWGKKTQVRGGQTQTAITATTCDFIWCVDVSSNPYVSIKVQTIESGMDACHCLCFNSMNALCNFYFSEMQLWYEFDDVITSSQDTVVIGSAEYQIEILSRESQVVSPSQELPDLMISGSPEYWFQARTKD